VAGRRIVIEFLGRDVSAGKTATEVDSKFGKLGGRLQKVGDAAGKMLVGGVLAGGAAMVKFGTQASDLAETQSKVAQIFGKDSVDALDKFAGSAAKNLGQSKQAALDGVATFGMFGKAAGKTGSDLVGFSTKMSTLASDMASFNNTSPEQAVEALGAALRGESEPIRAYGVMLDDATLKAEALSMGILKPVKDASKIKSAYSTLTNNQVKYNEALKEHGKNSLEAMTAEAHLGASQSALAKATAGTIPPLTMQQKALAAQSSIMKQTKDQQGDFARTSDGLANKQRILKAQFENLTTQLGQKSLPVMNQTVTAGLKMIDWSTKHSTATKVLVGSVAGLTAGFWLMSKAIAAATTIQTVSTTVMALAGKAALGTRIQLGLLAVQTKVMAAVQWLLNAAMTANPIGIVIVAIVALVAALVIAYKKSETFRKIVKGGFEAVGQAATWLWNNAVRPALQAIGKAMSVTMTIWSKVLGALSHVPGFGWAGKAADAMARAANVAWNLGDHIKKIPTKKDIKITITTTEKRRLEAGGYGPSYVGHNARGTNNWRGGPTWIGERGPEILDLPRGSRIIPNHKAAAAASGGGDFTAAAPIILQMDGRQVWQGLLKVKRQRGNLSLGLA